MVNREITVLAIGIVAATLAVGVFADLSASLPQETFLDEGN